MLSIPEFETRLKSGRYTTQGDARRAAFKLVIPEKARASVLEGISRHFGEGYRSVARPETSTSEPAPLSRGPLSAKLGEVARTNSRQWRKNKQDRSVAGRAGGLARAAKLRAEREELERLKAQAEAPPHAPTLHALPAVPPSAPAPLSVPTVSLADVRSETDRVVRELASKMPVVLPPPPEGVEHAYKMIAESARELFESLAEAVKADERLRPDLLRAAHSVAQLVETGNDVLLSKLTQPSKPTPPASEPRLAEAAE